MTEPAIDKLMAAVGAYADDAVIDWSLPAWEIRKRSDARAAAYAAVERAARELVLRARVETLRPLREMGLITQARLDAAEQQLRELEQQEVEG